MATRNSAKLSKLWRASPLPMRDELPTRTRKGVTDTRKDLRMTRFASSSTTSTV
jgi:hypothetical protein